MIYANGRLFEGEWKEDRREGRGYERYQNGSIFMGQFSKGKAHGHGIFKWVLNMEEYDG